MVVLTNNMKIKVNKYEQCAQNDAFNYHEFLFNN